MDKYPLILIDEYQDSNLVQEFLLQSISGEMDGKENRFMVGTTDFWRMIYCWKRFCRTR